MRVTVLKASLINLVSHSHVQCSNSMLLSARDLSDVPRLGGSCRPDHWSDGRFV